MSLETGDQVDAGSRMTIVGSCMLVSKQGKLETKSFLAKILHLCLVLVHWVCKIMSVIERTMRGKKKVEELNSILFLMFYCRK